ncbi:MAG TPA: hypothetical protein VMS73_03140, partial [Anaerolineaceae bacterium]|nr:hypothetical protein [Anaerolineaceae bacterium]
MDITETLQKAELLLAPFEGAVSHPSPERLDVILQEKSLKPAVKAVVDARWGYLTAITGLDHSGTTLATPEEASWQRISFEEPGPLEIQKEGSLEVLYHFCSGACVLTLRVSVHYSS